MDAATIVVSILGVLGVGGIVSGLLLNKLNKMDVKQETRERVRMEENVLVIQGLQAVGHLAEAAAIAQKNGKQNGETETALGYYRKYTDDMNAFLLRQNAARNHGKA